MRFLRIFWLPEMKSTHLFWLDGISLVQIGLEKLRSTSPLCVNRFGRYLRVCHLEFDKEAISNSCRGAKIEMIAAANRLFAAATHFKSMSVIFPIKIRIFFNRSQNHKWKQGQQVIWYYQTSIRILAVIYTIVQLRIGRVVMEHHISFIPYCQKRNISYFFFNNHSPI